VEKVMEMECKQGIEDKRASSWLGQDESRIAATRMLSIIWSL
jgi:hypothetical protein